MPEPRPDRPWLVIIDPQRIFADPASPWCAPGFGTIVGPVDRLAAAFGDQVLVTRWVPGAGHPGSWADYFERWPFADRPGTDPYFDLIDAAAGWLRRPTLDVTTFGKWGDAMAGIVGRHPHLVLAGVATDCCVISTALAAADQGAWVDVVADACAGSDPGNHAAACQVMDLYSPQIRVRTIDQILS
ncbi:cysteine hydrolase family protein [Acidipropionibacterium virtanenii]|uniref:Isochorismatase-like domain-containing protein n=1 Tax=Acidipropionibacterium virtanenii TaxID=2057246 RepID=A0A344UVP2_9ACTN|nr:cysteine hydrolase [Acidipropionibacterium virtanenii]AXE39340.1 hypothetical protein JS278_02188 [Acidipropionibacterium virtanenii]